MGTLGKSSDSSQVQDAVEHLGGAGNGMKCGNSGYTELKGKGKLSHT